MNPTVIILKAIYAVHKDETIKPLYKQRIIEVLVRTKLYILNTYQYENERNMCRSTVQALTFASKKC